MNPLITTLLLCSSAPALAHPGHGGLDGGFAGWTLLGCGLFAALAAARRLAGAIRPPIDDG